MKIEYQGLNHASVLVRNLQASLDFYQGILGMAIDDTRPDIGFNGAWLQVAEHQIHLLELPNPDPSDNRPEHAGRDRHVAVTVTDIEPLILILEQENIKYSKSKSGRAAVFFRDPDGNGLEYVQR